MPASQWPEMNQEGMQPLIGRRAFVAMLWRNSQRNDVWWRRWWWSWLRLIGRLLSAFWGHSISSSSSSSGTFWYINRERRRRRVNGGGEGGEGNSALKFSQASIGVRVCAGVWVCECVSAWSVIGAPSSSLPLSLSLPLFLSLSLSLVLSILSESIRKDQEEEDGGERGGGGGRGGGRKQNGGAFVGLFFLLFSYSDEFFSPLLSPSSFLYITYIYLYLYNFCVCIGDTTSIPTGFVWINAFPGSSSVAKLLIGESGSPPLERTATTSRQ